MTKIIQTLLIKGELTDLNTYINAERSNRYHAANIKKRETDAIKILSYKLKPIKEQVDIEILWFMKDSRKDPDNISFAKKFIMDGLVEAGILENDGQKQIKSFSDKFFVDKSYPRVEVVIMTKE